MEINFACLIINPRSLACLGESGSLWECRANVSACASEMLLGAPPTASLR